jgi:CubicO group peptidase (beta-lactamase class C family)
MRRIIPLTLWLMLVLVAPAFAQTDDQPWPTDGWQTSSPEAQGMDSTLLAEMLDNIIQRGVNIHSLLVVRDGYLVLEAYRHPYTADIPHQIYSATKSITSALVGIAIEQGYIQGIDQPILDFFADRTIANLDDSKRAITIDHLLSMSSGLDWTDEMFNLSTNNEMLGSPDQVQFVLDRPMANEPGERYVYNSAGSHLLSAIIEQTTGQTALAFAQANLFAPLGIQTTYWTTDLQGRNLGGTGMQLTPRDMAKFGYLFLNGGMWDGQQVISSEWVDTATQKHIDARPIADGYGYQWWVDFRGYYAASGYGGQYIIVVPAENLVVVMTSELSNSDTIVQRETILQDYILPAIKSEAPLPANPEGMAALQAAIDALVHPAPVAVQPLPETATRISGQVYHFEANDYGLESVSLTFADDADTAHLVVNDFPPVEVGLDDLFRVNPMPDYTPLFVKGSWTTDNRFLVKVQGPGTTTPYQMTFTFHDQDVQVITRDNYRSYTFTVEGTAAD